MIILLVGVIFVGAVVAIPAINSSTFQAIDQQQLKNTALNVLNSMLLGVGSPANWGSNHEIEVEEVGLAYSGSFSKYILDSDKVQRLDPYNPWHLTREQVLDLLNLQGYGFNLTFYRPFRAVSQLEIDFANNMVHFDLTVTRSQDGAPIPNAEIYFNIFSSTISGGLDPVGPVEGPYWTDPTGCFTKDFTIDPGMITVIAFAKITVGGMSTIVVEQDGYINLDDFIQINTSGDTVALSIRDEEELNEEWHWDEIPPASRWITNGWAYKSESLNEIYIGEGHVNFGSKSVEFESIGLSELDPTALVIRLTITIPKSAQRYLELPDSIKSAAKVPVYIVGALDFGADEKILGFGYLTPNEKVIATMRRFVVISDMTYIAEISLWKE